MLYILFLINELSFQNIKIWDNSDNFIKNIYDNYWTISDNSKYFVKATNDDFGEIYYYKENTPENFANTFEVKLHNKNVMLNIRTEIRSECNFFLLYCGVYSRLYSPVRSGSGPVPGRSFVFLTNF